MRRRVDLAALEESLALALNNALMGDGWSRSLQYRLETVARAELRRVGLENARVKVEYAKGLIEVDVRLPPQGPRVRAIRLRLGVG